MRTLVLAMTGASGAVYAARLLEVLLVAGHQVHLTLSPAAGDVLRQELGLSVDLEAFDPAVLLPGGGASDSRLPLLLSGAAASHALSDIIREGDAPGGQVVYHHHRDFSAGIASGSFRTDGMVICPCSMGTLAAVAHGQSANLIQRAADVHLKERRKLIVVPRETPLGSIQLDNMKRLADAGAVVLPAMPGFYHSPSTIHDLVDFIVGRVCDQLGVEQQLIRRWGTSG
ncbi:MAG: UbiX family flavin prenyltransferase [Planctomycetes bacterium]|nr:UbiX family flavin prenyltransferase [Planctomycetota bacterium]